MTESAERPLLEHMKRFQATLERMEGELREIKTRAANLESGQASMMQHLAHYAATQAGQQVAMDRMSDRLDRIERQLELNQ